MNKKHSVVNMLYKAIYNALIGFPISMILNLSLLNWMYYVIHDYLYVVAGILIGVPYFIASVIRQFLIDYAYEKHNVDISPQHLIELVWRQFKNERI